MYMYMYLLLRPLVGQNLCYSEDLHNIVYRRLTKIAVNNLIPPKKEYFTYFKKIYGIHIQYIQLKKNVFTQSVLYGVKLP